MAAAKCCLRTRHPWMATVSLSALAPALIHLDCSQQRTKKKQDEDQIANGKALESLPQVCLKLVSTLSLSLKSFPFPFPFSSGLFFWCLGLYFGRPDFSTLVRMINHGDLIPVPEPGSQGLQLPVCCSCTLHELLYKKPLQETQTLKILQNGPCSSAL